MHYRRLLLPMSDDNEVVNMLLGVANIQPISRIAARSERLGDFILTYVKLALHPMATGGTKVTRLIRQR